MKLSQFVGFRGRINRTEYLIVLLLGYFLPFGIVFAVQDYADLGDPGIWISVPLMVVGVWCFFSAMARRFHDINMTAWACLLVFVPLVGALTPIVLIFYPGVDPDNRFGPPAESSVVPG